MAAKSVWVCEHRNGSDKRKIPRLASCSVILRVHRKFAIAFLNGGKKTLFELLLLLLCRCHDDVNKFKSFSLPFGFFMWRYPRLQLKMGGSEGCKAWKSSRFVDFVYVSLCIFYPSVAADDNEMTADVEKSSQRSNVFIYSFFIPIQRKALAVVIRLFT